VINQDIPDAFDYINSTTGIYKHIAYELVNGQEKRHKIFNIVDKDVLKQEKLKAIRDENKANIPKLTKDQIGNAVWKYRYVPPGLETDYFERNRTKDDVIKFRPVNRVNPYARKEFNERPAEEYIPTNYESQYSKKKLYLNNFG
jgi:hypothetical protein